MNSVDRTILIEKLQNMHPLERLRSTQGITYRENGSRCVTICIDRPRRFQSFANGTHGFRTPQTPLAAASLLFSDPLLFIYFWSATLFVHTPLPRFSISRYRFQLDSRHDFKPPFCKNSRSPQQHLDFPKHSVPYSRRMWQNIRPQV